MWRPELVLGVSSDNEVGIEIEAMLLCRGLNGGQDLDLLGSTVSTGSSPHSLVEGLGLMQGFTAAETSETLLTRLSDGLPNSRLGFSNMDQLIDGGQQYSLPLSEVCLRLPL